MGFIMKEYHGKGKNKEWIDIATGRTHGNIFSPMTKGYSKEEETLEEYRGILSGDPIGIIGKQIDPKMGVGSLILDHTLETIKNRFQDQLQHYRNVEVYSIAIGKILELRDCEMKDLASAARMHDIGKAFIEPKLLNKVQKLNKEEMEEVKKHPEIGYWLLKADKRYRRIAEYVRYHHEYWNGLGYPGGLKGEETPLLSRIIAIADAYDAMSTDRVYQKKKNRKEAMEELMKHSGSQFDPRIVKIFVEKIVL